MDERNFTKIQAKSSLICEFLESRTHQPQKEVSFDVELRGKSVFVAGFYNKWERNISQTPWFVDGAFKTELSVSGVIEEALHQIFQFSNSKFCSAGREDADVKMVGNGRPFLFELIDVCKRERIPFFQNTPTAFQEEFDVFFKHKGLVSATQLCIANGPKATSQLKKGEEEKQKTYRCLIWSEREIDQKLLDERIDSCVDLDIVQTTPIRVLQRRALMNRKKRIFEMASQAIDSHYFVLHIKTDAGTHIKEFVHGDLGRTVPSFKNILWPDDAEPPKCDILELDVLSVELPNWPPTS